MIITYSKFCTRETVYAMTHTLAGCYTGTVVNQDGGEDGAKHLEALLRLASTPQLDAEQGEECGRRRLLLPVAWREREVTILFINNCSC